jgi:probable phosphoglycerate mutase
MAQPIVNGTPVAPLRLYLIRHGETDWSLASKHTSYTDLPLTDQGEADARRLRDKLPTCEFNRVFTSPSRRARWTSTLAGVTPFAEIEPALAEWNYGDYEGQRSVDIQKERPRWNLFQDGCPQGESPAQVCARADLLIAHLRGLNGNIALFTHGQFGSVLAVRWVGLPIVTAQHFPLGTASVSVFGYSANHPELPVISSLSAR